MTGRPAKVLIVDDDARNRKLLETLLAPEGYVTASVASGVDALASIGEHAPDLVLLDVMMPGMSGHQVAAAIKGDPATRNIPIIMLTAQTDRAARLAALDAGAEDILTKPFDRTELWLRVRNLLRLKELSDLLENEGARLEREVRARTVDLRHQAHYDALTGLPNRTLVNDILESSLANAADRGCPLAVLFIDIDNFKNVNDTLGHAIGDELLIQLGKRLLGCVRVRDTVGRLGGDEFAVILVADDVQHGAAAVATQIARAVSAPFDLHGHQVTVSVSVGITAYPDDAADAPTLLKYADTAMYQAKQAGRDTFRFFTPRMNADAMARLDLETALRRAVQNGEFELHYQPKTQMDSGRVCGLEALLRWRRPGHGLVLPAEFIPVLEESGLIVEVGRWVIRTACAQVARWLASPVGSMQVSVNVSGRQFIEGDLCADVLDAIAEHDIPAALLELELTESTLMVNTDATVAILHELRERGVKISIDDFGTGYSSLAYLRRFPIDKLKIDGSFVRNITEDVEDAAIALAIIGMANTLKLDVIAEGVETPAQHAYLRRHRCDQMQGYLVSPPLPAAETESFLVDHASRRAVDVDSAGPASVVLLVDDDACLLEALKIALGDDGYFILTAPDAATAFERLALHDVQVVVCDEYMPAMTGTDFLARAKDLHPAVVRVMLSSTTDNDVIVRAVNRAGLYRYHRKPWTEDALRQDVRDALRHHRSLHDQPDTPPATSQRRGRRPTAARARSSVADATSRALSAPLATTSST